MAGAGTIEEDAHAEGFSALGRHQAHLPPDMIGARQVCYLCLIPLGIALEAIDSLLDGAAKAGTDLEGFLEIEVVDHGGTSASILQAGPGHGNHFLKKFFSRISVSGR
jgi:hypothetical protein